MAKIIEERMAAELEGDFVIFLIGMRINKPWKFWKWMPVAGAMPRMLAELAKHPELGLMHAYTKFGIRNVMVVQYWRSFEALQAYAVNPDTEHLPAWRDFNRAVASNGDVGIWHETYLVQANGFEAIYNNMPVMGLGQAGRLVPARGRKTSASGRLGRTDGTDQPEND